VPHSNTAPPNPSVKRDGLKAAPYLKR
jgi:hypothetical protein